MIRFYLLGTLLVLSSAAVAQSYAVSSIPIALRLNAHAVVRFQETEFHVKNAGEATTRVNGAVTVLDEQGDRFATLAIPYNKFTKINDLEAQLYDANGERIKRLKRADIESFSTNSGENTIDDSYVKAAVLKHKTYPYTVAYAYEYTTRNMMFYPIWKAYPYNALGTSVEKNTFTVSLPAELALRYKEQNLSAPGVVGTSGGRTTYTWEASSLRPLQTEPYAPGHNLTLPQVFTGPSDFEVEKYKGKLATWQDVGAFYRDLNQSRQALPPALVSTLQEQTRGLRTPLEKAQKLYEYLQAHTRYVSIQLGLGGWQSMRAEEVAAKGYGDCKALTNYMSAMLQAVGVPSYPALVRAGEDEDDIRTDFPSFQFNHVILCLPTAPDTVWLECTSQNNPFGYLGSFTSDRHVVLITEQGGYLTRTPQYQPLDNLLHRQAQVKLAANGEATIQVKTVYSGLQQDGHANVLHYLGADDQKKWIQKSLRLPSAEVQQFAFKETRARIPSVEENLTLFVRNASNRSGTRIFLNPNLLNQATNVPLAEDSRKSDFVITQHYTDLDSISFELPENYTIEHLPEAVQILSAYGSYEASVQLSGTTLTYLRRVTMTKGRYPAAEFNAWVDFRKKIVRADKNQIVLVQK